MSQNNEPESDPGDEAEFPQLEELESQLPPITWINSSTQSSGPRFKLLGEVGRKSQPALTQPVTLCLDGPDRVLVIDRSEDDGFRLRSLSLQDDSGDVLAKLAKGEEDSQLMEATAVAVRGDEIIILDAASGALKRFSRDGRWLATFASAGPGGDPLGGPRDVDVDDKGNLYIADTNNDRVVNLDIEGELVWIIDEFPAADGDDEPDGLFEPGSVCCGPQGVVYVADSNQNRVIRFDANRQPTLVIEEEGGFEFPSRVRLAPTGDDVFVSDRRNVRVQRFDGQGRRSAALSTSAEDASAEVQGGADFAVDAGGHVVMINPLRESVVTLDFLER